MRLVAAALVAIAPAAPAWALDGSLSVLPSTSAVTPGTPFVLHVQARWPQPATAVAPDLQSWLPAGLHVQDRRARPFAEGGWRGFDVDLDVEAARGLYAVPPLAVTVSGGTTRRTLMSDPLYLEVPPGEGADLSQLRPLKPLRSIRTWQPVAIAGAAAAALALIAGIVVWRRRRAQPALDPYTELARAVTDIRNRAAAGGVDRDSAFAMSRALRNFAERVSGVSALEMTGREFVRACDDLHGPLAPVWRQIAGHCDRLENVKFGPQGRSERPVEVWIAPIGGWVTAIRGGATAPETAA